MFMRFEDTAAFVPIKLIDLDSEREIADQLNEMFPTIRTKNVIVFSTEPSNFCSTESFEDYMVQRFCCSVEYPCERHKDQEAGKNYNVFEPVADD